MRSFRKRADGALGDAAVSGRRAERQQGGHGVVSSRSVSERGNVAGEMVDAALTI